MGGMVVVSSALRGSSEHLGQPADHFRGKQSFGAVGIWKPESQSFGTVRKGLTGRCPTKGIDLSSEGSQGLERKRIGSRPAIELRFDPRAAFFVPYFLSLVFFLMVRIIGSGQDSYCLV